MLRLRTLGRKFWPLAKAYWQGEERWSARALLIACVGLNFGIVYVNVLLNRANGTLFNALQERRESGFYQALGTILLLILLYVAVALLRYFLDQTLQLRWRRWLTDRLLSRWLAGKAFYRMRFSGRVDNPDQRIAEDIRTFISQSLSLGLGLLSSLVSLATFAVILWHLSGSISIPVAGISVTIPGYMLWAAILYAGIGSVLAHVIGRPLIRLGNRQQGVEADFRFGLVRLREEAEQIALYRGEAEEQRSLRARFAALYQNFLQLIRWNTGYLTFDVMVGQLAAFFPLVVGAPRYFSGAIELGALMQIAGAFGQVNTALSWFMDNYTSFANWRANLDRLSDFSDELDRQTAAAPARLVTPPAGRSDAIILDQLRLTLPDGRPLLGPISLRLGRGERLLIKGPSGTGKSTLFRAIAGLWPFAEGRIEVPPETTPLFLPQRPYMPIGSLREAVWFPRAPDWARDSDARNALAAAGLAPLGRRLDEQAHWGQILSPGEQQRLAFARALLAKPDWLFLDEATSALEEAQETALYSMIARELPNAGIVSIGHRRSLEALHDHTLDLTELLIPHAA